MKRMVKYVWRGRRFAVLLATAIVFSVSCDAQRDWLRFRGEGGLGATSTSVRPPLALKWKLNLQLNPDPARYFNPLAFGLPDAGYYGTLGRNSLVGPGLVNLDGALHKVLWQTERQAIRLRIEAFNAANRPNFQIPSGLSLFDSTGRRVATAGQITSTATTSRQIQFALKWAF